MRAGRRACVAAVLIVALAQVRAMALEVQVKDVGTRASVVRAGLELRDLVPDRFKRVLDDNGVLHLRLQVELWETRPVWDRLVYPATLRVVRMTRDTVPTAPVTVTLDIGKTDRIVASGKYYLHVLATLGTLAEREADTVGDAVFGREGESNSLGSLGRLVFRTALQISDYLQSVTAQTTRKVSGADLLKTAP
ncbi:MAG TPA: hypothetical protein VH583_13935 [Vicinamibacterales bacterium]|jgi:hypothetical protein